MSAFIAWEKKLSVRRSVVLFVTLWMTYRAFAWAAVYASCLPTVDASAALMIASVTAPITYLQKVVFEAYIAAKDAA